MINTINMQDMRYLNLFSKITGVSTRYCFKYNESIVFIVPLHLVSKSIGENGKNIRRISETLGKKIKVVFMPESIRDAKKFIGTVISPTEFKDLEFNNNEIIINAGSQNKAALIGREKRRLYELQKIARDFFGKDLKIA